MACRLLGWSRAAPMRRRHPRRRPLILRHGQNSLQLRRMNTPTGCSQRPTAATHLEASSAARHTAAMIMAARIEVFQQQLSRCCRHCHRRITAPSSVTNVIQSAKTAAFSTEKHSSHIPESGAGTDDNMDAVLATSWSLVPWLGPRAVCSAWCFSDSLYTSLIRLREG